MSKENNSQEFELNLLFNGQKHPADAFSSISENFQTLYYYDKWVLSSISDLVDVEYSITNLQYSSIKSRIAQLITIIPDDAIAELDWKKMVGAILLKAKYRLLKYLGSNKNIDKRTDIDAITDGINKDIAEIKLSAVIIVNPLNSLYLVNIYEEMIRTINKLKDGEEIEYKSTYGIARVSNGINFDRAKIISDLGEETVINETTEILKVKKLDMLSDKARWDFKRDHQALDGVKISDVQWLKDYHERKFSLLPDDCLKVKLKTTYIHSPNPDFSRANYEILKVLEVIPPSKPDTLLF